MTDLASASYTDPSHIGQLNALSSQLASKLAVLHTQGPSTVGMVRSTSYPDIRYVRHDSEFPTLSSPSADIADLQAHVQYVYSELLTITKESI